MNAYLYIELNDPDICGKWKANEVEEEMIELEIPLENEWTWLEYLFDRIFDRSYDIEIIDALVKILRLSDSIMIDMMHNGIRINIQYVCS